MTESQVFVRFPDRHICSLHPQGKEANRQRSYEGAKARWACND